MRQQPQNFVNIGDAEGLSPFIASSPSVLPRPRVSFRYHRHALHEIAYRLRRRSDPAAAGRNVGHDPRLRAQHRAGADGDVVGEADLPSHHDEISHFRAAGNAGLPGDQAVPADADVVRDLHQIVDLGALADDGVAGRAAVDRGVGADLDVILNDDPAGLRNFLMASRRRQIAEAVLADARAGMDDHAIADQGMQ